MKLASTVAVVAFFVSCGYEAGQPLGDEYGYFVFDKSTGVLVQGLSEFEVKRVFSENGWNYADLVDATL